MSLYLLQNMNGVPQLMQLTLIENDSTVNVNDCDATAISESYNAAGGIASEDVTFANGQNDDIVNGAGGQINNYCAATLQNLWARKRMLNQNLQLVL